MGHISNIDQVPPYGYMDDGEWTGIGDAPDCMRLEGRKPGHDRYARWVKDLAEELADGVWPLYEPVKGSWKGAARSYAMDLSVADLNLRAPLAKLLKTPIHRRPGARTRQTLHKQFFLEEDGVLISRTRPRTATFEHWGQHYERYDHALTPTLARLLGKQFDAAAGDVVGSIDDDLKSFMQRPRPYQMAMLLGRLPRYPRHSAFTANTPSMIGGHALESALGGSFVYLKHRKALERADGVAYWQQLVVDVGDRRVFAGLHYPSDSVASWYCALRAADALFPQHGADVRDFLWEAITQRSALYALMARRPAPAHRRLLAWLHTAAPW